MRRAPYLVGLVNRDRPTIRSQLLETTFHFKQVLDVQWRIDHSVRTKYQDQIGEPTFLIDIITAGGKGVRVTCLTARCAHCAHSLTVPFAAVRFCDRSSCPCWIVDMLQSEPGTRQEVKFACSREELQDLVASLKDACTQVDRILGTSRKK